MVTLACRRLLIHIHLCEQEDAIYDDSESYEDTISPPIHSRSTSLRNSLKADSEFAIELHNYEVSSH